MSNTQRMKPIQAPIILSDIFPKHSLVVAPQGAISRKVRANVRPNYQG